MTTRTDVCLILEGTYPYVTGGVASWVHQLITGLPDLSFSIALILSKSRTPRQYKYALPPNVREIRQIYLHEFELPETKAEGIEKPGPDVWNSVNDFHTCPFSKEKLQNFEKMYQRLFDPKTRAIAPRDLLDSPEAWQILEELYQDNASDSSFIDYFWTCRFMHYPMFKILTAELPVAGVYHALSTGYAGLLAAVAKVRFRRPVMLTEHGIYTRERRMEISRVDWIYERDDQGLQLRNSRSDFKALWNQMFISLSRLTYEYSDVIITLFKGNQSYQLEDGAGRQKMAVIPNAIDTTRFKKVEREDKKPTDPFVVGLVARVVQIKDVKTFIRACKMAASKIPNFKVYIVGPTDEDPVYYDECVKLTDFLGLKHIVEFTGKTDTAEFYPKLDILALTSISEAQPLVILEANCMGIPIIATDVGGCRELLVGSREEDEALGESGMLVNINDPESVAEAIVQLWRDPELRQKMAATGQERVQKFYDRKDLLSRYRRLYEHLIVHGVPRQTSKPEYQAKEV